MAKGLADCGAAGPSLKICEVYFVGRLRFSCRLFPSELVPLAGTGHTKEFFVVDWKQGGGEKDEEEMALSLSCKADIPWRVDGL
jgi:hypothetical protein